MPIANAITMRIKCLLAITGALIFILLIATLAFADIAAVSGRAAGI